ncbi:MAG: response regulator transcription factor [Bacteroidota bacterium]
MLTLSLIEDNEYYANSLKEIVHMQPDMKFLLCATSVQDFTKRLPSRSMPDLLFLDIGLPDILGSDAIPDLKKKLKHTEIVMLTVMEDTDALMLSLNRGAAGYLIKNFPILQFPSLVRTFMNGGALLSPTMARKLIKSFHPKQNSLDILSKKERHVLQLLSSGCSYEDVSNILDITVSGAKYHIRNVYKKLNVKTKIEAVNTFHKLNNETTLKSS